MKLTKWRLIVVKIRLARGGAKKAPYYRVVVIDSRKQRNGKSIESIGFYNPMVKENRFNIDAERVKYWLSVGAQPSDRVRALMKDLEAKSA